MPTSLEKKVKIYVDEISVPGIPYVSTSHIKLRNLRKEFGEDVVTAEVDRQLKERGRRQGSESDRGPCAQHRREGKTQ